MMSAMNEDSVCPAPQNVPGRSRAPLHSEAPQPPVPARAGSSNSARTSRSRSCAAAACIAASPRGHGAATAERQSSAEHAGLQAAALSAAEGHLALPLPRPGAAPLACAGCAVFSGDSDSADVIVASDEAELSCGMKGMVQSTAIASSAWVSHMRKRFNCGASSQPSWSSNACSNKSEALPVAVWARDRRHGNTVYMLKLSMPVLEMTAVL
eukprot:CAMPEP_0179220568 /NCGR_PEP_ID=MMETSP0797-20121207/5696_1 /TAXON_ID=47934 /ORGANISM="Dinophysis acuminata, Strain DAEP01" /LENGTH=210 /DNA_ID=CAMNT_0020927231 /DNA_START=213 /DNA_END=841 /DNA_ORIENTATION=-